MRETALWLRQQAIISFIPLLDRKSSRHWQKGIADGISEWWEVLEARAMHEADPINPQRLFWELSPRLPDNCILTCDSGSAAKFAHPDRVVIAMVGDGAMQMPGNDGLVTISKYWKTWSDPRLIVLVLKNLDLNMVTWATLFDVYNSNDLLDEPS